MSCEQFWCEDNYAKRAKGDNGLSSHRLYVQCTYVSPNLNSSTDEGDLLLQSCNKIKSNQLCFFFDETSFTDAASRDYPDTQMG